MIYFIAPGLILFTFIIYKAITETKRQNKIIHDNMWSDFTDLKNCNISGVNQIIEKGFVLHKDHSEYGIMVYSKTFDVGILKWFAKIEVINNEIVGWMVECNGNSGVGCWGNWHWRSVESKLVKSWMHSENNSIENRREK